MLKRHFSTILSGSDDQRCDNSDKMKNNVNDELLTVFSKRKDNKKLSKNENVADDGETNKNEAREFKTFSDIVVERSVSDLRLLFENTSSKKDETDKMKTENVRTPSRLRKKGWRKLVPIKGQKTIDTFLVKYEAGKQTPESGKRKIEDDDVIDFNSANTPKLKSIRRLGSKKH